MLVLTSMHSSATSSGELAVRGDNLFTEYWNRPEATAESFDGEGFFLYVACPQFALVQSKLPHSRLIAILQDRRHG